jgi:hypothetical protein
MKQENLVDDVRLMFFDLVEGLREEMEVHDEPSLHLVESVHDWSLRLLELGILSDIEFEVYHELVNEAGKRTEME